MTAMHTIVVRLPIDADRDRLVTEVRAALARRGAAAVGDRWAAEAPQSWGAAMASAIALGFAFVPGPAAHEPGTVCFDRVHAREVYDRQTTPVLVWLERVRDGKPIVAGVEIMLCSRRLLDHHGDLTPLGAAVLAERDAARSRVLAAELCMSAIGTEAERACE